MPDPHSSEAGAPLLDAPPLDAPALDAESLAALRLCLVEGVGPRIRKALLERFGSAQAVLAAAPSELRDVPGVGPKLGRSLATAGQIAAEDDWRRWRERQVRLLFEHQPEYPQRLREIPDPPGVLFVRGELTPADALAFAIVGTRHATHYGLDMAERFAAGLARAGYTIVSGLARGIDGAAHRGALAAGGRTLAVLGSGVLEIYPPEHADLARNLLARGALVSEALPEATPRAGMFPQRNRIITGLSLGLLVVEASDNSGALVSARHALEQGREVFAIPGRIDSRNSRGCHRLIRDGAKLVESVDDILEELGPLPAAAPAPDGRDIRHAAELQLNEPEQTVLAAVRLDATSIDEVVAASGLPAPRVLAILSVLEMRRLIRRLGGARVLRV